MTHALLQLDGQSAPGSMVDAREKISTLFGESFFSDATKQRRITQ